MWPAEIVRGRPFTKRAEPTHALNSLPRRPHIRYEGRTGSGFVRPFEEGGAPGGTGNEGNGMSMRRDIGAVKLIEQMR